MWTEAPLSAIHSPLERTMTSEVEGWETTRARVVDEEDLTTWATLALESAREPLKWVEEE